MAVAVRPLREAEGVSRARLTLLLMAAAAVILLIWGFTRRATPPKIPFIRVMRSTVVSALSTNGKVEPIEWASARAEQQGAVQKVFVQRGDQVKKGAALVALEVTNAAADLAAADAEIASAQAQGQVLRQGGPQAQRTQIENELAAARITLKNAQKEHDSLQRLVAKQAATRVELEGARQKIEQAQLQIQGLERRQAALVSPTDLPVAQAKLHEAQSAAALARRNLSQSIVRSPIDGTVYQFDLRIGSFLHPGDLVANVGRLDQVRVTVYVDEPDLGRVEKGMPVNITWDALPGRQWKGAVDRLPTEVVPLGSRQVGEVSCIIANPDHDLLPGTNVNAEIQSRVVQNALTIPKEAIRREGDVSGVYLLDNERLVWRPVKLGVSSYTKAQVLQGLAEGQAVALPTDRPLKNDMRVSATYP